MNDRERELALVLRKALRKKRAFGLLPVMRDTTLVNLYPIARRFLHKIADRRLTSRRGVWVGRNEHHVWVAMNDYILDLDDEKYIGTIYQIIKSNYIQGYITEEEFYNGGDKEDDNRD